MREFSLTGVACATLVAVLLNLPSISAAEELSFVPSLTGSEADLELDMTSQTNEYTQGGTKTTTRGDFYGEKINAAAEGYVYHPRFQQFQTRVSGDLTESSVSGSSSYGSRTTSALDYELRTIFLPEHPYNLELYAIHEEASAPGAFWAGQRAATTEKGADFNYKDNPYFLSMVYDTISVDSSVNRSDTYAYRLHGAYNGVIMSHSTNYAHSETHSSLDINTTAEQYAYGNAIRYADVVLNSRIGNDETSQKRPQELNFNSNVLTWTEELTAPLPWNFSTNGSFWYRDDVDRTSNGVTGAANTEEFNRSTTTTFNLSHHLYQSLTTNFTYGLLSNKSTLGEITGWSDSISSTYMKKIPVGRLTMGVQYGTSKMERQGTLTIIDEPHNVALYGSFPLGTPDIIANTLVIKIKDPAAKDPATGALITMPYTDYSYDQRRGIVTINSVAPATLQLDQAYVYEFHVSYSLADQSTIDTDSMGYSMKLDVLENLLSAYYSYFNTSQEIESGSIAGGPDRTTTQVEGLSAQSGPYSGLIEHQTFESRLNPSDSWKTTAQYSVPAANNITYTVFLSTVHTHYLPSSGAFASSGYRETRTGADVRMDMKFPLHNLNYFLATSYYETRSLIDSNMLSLNSYLIWNVGLLSLNGGMQLSRSESMLPEGKTSLVAQYYYVTLNRKLF